VWDFTVPEHHNYFIGETNQHNSSKTEYGARSVVKAALENPKSIIVCFAQDADASIRTQQSALSTATCRQSLRLRPRACWSI
jgi:hypothetical protein